MTNTPRQLVFELSHRPALGLEDFLVSASNEEAVALVDRWPDWPAGAAIIVGPAGSGKTHLANVWRARTKAVVVEASTLDLDQVPRLAAAGALVVEGIATRLDDAALFHLLNLVREQRIAILMTARVAPGDLAVRLPDLASRLNALPLATIAPPDDVLLRAVLVKLFADRQLAVDPLIIDYVLVRMERSLAAAARLVEEVDRQALALHRRVTRTIAASALETLRF